MSNLRLIRAVLPIFHTVNFPEFTPTYPPARVCSFDYVSYVDIQLLVRRSVKLNVRYRPETAVIILVQNS